MSNASKDFYAMNLPDSQADKLIAKYEADITKNLEDLSKKEPDLKQAEQMYLEAKAEVDVITKELEENKSMLEVLARFRNNESGSKEFRILRTTSNLDKPAKEKKQRHFKWLVMAEEILLQKDHFISMSELFREILKTHPEIEQFWTGQQVSISLVEKRTINSFTRACLETRERKMGTFTNHMEKIGLYKWVTDDFLPEPKHLKEFMHAHTPVKNGHRVVPIRPTHKVQAKTVARSR